MDLRSHYPFFFLKNGILNSYPSLQQNEQCDVAIIGAGISGALVAWYLGQAGISTVLLDRRHAASGSTAASTSLLQYEIDVPLTELATKVGIDDAVTSYRLCLDAIEELGSISGIVEPQSSFENKPSFQFASYKSHVKKLREEFELRQQHGFPVKWLDENEVVRQFGFNKPAGILSAAGADADAYQFTHNLLAYCVKKLGARLYDKTTVDAIQHTGKKTVLTTTDGCTITCKKLVIASGYESQRYISQKVQQLYATYVTISEPFAPRDFWHKNALVWETANPYLYMRTTTDHRILIGGKDVPYTSAVARDKQLNQKVIALEKTFASLCPDINYKTDFKWAGTFAGTKDGLPYIGEHADMPGVLFALGFGGNGITFSVIAGKIITDIITGKKNGDANIFKFDR